MVCPHNSYYLDCGCLTDLSKLWPKIFNEHTEYLDLTRGDHGGCHVSAHSIGVPDPTSTIGSL